MPYFFTVNFTAQGFLVGSLMQMYGEVERTGRRLSNHEVAPIVVFMAFSCEAYLNGIGARVAPFWDHVERNRWKEKVEILHSLAGRTPDWGRQPLQFLKEIFDVRDKLAHGKPQDLESGPFEDAAAFNSDYWLRELQPGWFKRLDHEWAIDAKEKFRLLMAHLAELHGLHESDHLLSSTGNMTYR